jgi:hypothetical protein
MSCGAGIQSMGAVPNVLGPCGRSAISLPLFLIYVCQRNERRQSTCPTAAERSAPGAGQSACLPHAEECESPLVSCRDHGLRETSLTLAW